MKRRSSKGTGMAPAERLELRGLGCSHQSGLRLMACGGFVSFFSWPVLWFRPAYRHEVGALEGDCSPFLFFLGILLQRHLRPFVDQ